MSAGVERRPAATRLGRWWQSWRFHLNAGLVIVPLLAVPGAWHEAKLAAGLLSPAPAHDAALRAGPFALRLSQIAAPTPDQRGVLLALCPGCAERIREVHLSAGPTPPARPEAGAIFLGPPARMQALAPARLPGAHLWLTVVEWNGARHDAQLPDSFATSADR